MAKVSAGLMPYRIRNGAIEVFLVHPGGPFWAKKDDGAWTFPRGEVNEGEDLLAAAHREFQEETGLEAGQPLKPLGKIRHKSGKTVHAWAFEGDFDLTKINSNTFSMEWPPRSGQMKSLPEIDRADYFSLVEANRKIMQAERPLLEMLLRLVNGS